MAATFKFDTETLNSIQGLKSRLGARTDEEVIQKALALAKLAIANADGDSNLTISSSAGTTNINLKT